MSRGPGRWQRTILDLLADHPGHGIVLTDSSWTAAEQVAIRRAAYRLEETGKLKLTMTYVGPGPARLTAYPPDADVPPPLLVTGLDGKVYRRPPLLGHHRD